MVKLNINDLLTYHEYWRENLPSEKADQYIALSRTLMHRVIDNDGILSGITLTFPEDCSDLSILKDFLEVMSQQSSWEGVQIKDRLIITF